MGYSRDYIGKMESDRVMDMEDIVFLDGLFSTRRMKREGLHEGYGIDGEFYVYAKPFDMNIDSSVVNQNKPPRTQPSLWCDMELLEDNRTIVWSGVEKTYKFQEWLEYIIKVLGDKYTFNGRFEYQGEDCLDSGMIAIVDNMVAPF